MFIWGDKTNGDSLMKAIVPIVFVVGLLLIGLTGTSAEDQTVELKVKAGLVPSSTFYNFDIAFESIRGWFVISDESKARFYINRAEERLAEAQAEQDSNNTAELDILMQDYQKYLAKAQIHAEASGDANTEEFVRLRVQTHLSVLQELKLSLPANARLGIETALNNSNNVLLKFGQE